MKYQWTEKIPMGRWIYGDPDGVTVAEIERDGFEWLAYDLGWSAVAAERIGVYRDIDTAKRAVETYYRDRELRNSAKA